MKEYKYDSDKDRIVTEENLKSVPYGPVCVNTKTIFNSSMLDALREALGMKKRDEQKYTVQVVPDDSTGYLNMYDNFEEAAFSDDRDYNGYKSHFTLKEIEILKQRDDLAIDWDKAIIEPVD